jgi:hypothetical protein
MRGWCRKRGRGFYNYDTNETPAAEEPCIAEESTAEVVDESRDAEPDHTTDSDHTGTTHGPGPALSESVERATDLASMTCQAPTNGIAAIPCIMIQSVNLIAKGINNLEVLIGICLLDSGEHGSPLTPTIYHLHHALYSKMGLFIGTTLLTK